MSTISDVFNSSVIDAKTYFPEDLQQRYKTVREFLSAESYFRPLSLEIDPREHSRQMQKALADCAPFVIGSLRSFLYSYLGLPDSSTLKTEIEYIAFAINSSGSVSGVIAVESSETVFEEKKVVHLSMARFSKIEQIVKQLINATFAQTAAFDLKLTGTKERMERLKEILGLSSKMVSQKTHFEHYADGKKFSRTEESFSLKVSNFMYPSRSISPILVTDKTENSYPKFSDDRSECSDLFEIDERKSESDLILARIESNRATSTLPMGSPTGKFTPSIFSPSPYSFVSRRLDSPQSE